jgi:hypothetical protein
MKTLHLFILLGLVIISSCEKDNNVSVDMNGIWYGTYTHDGISGTFKTRLTQSSALCKGELSIKYDAPSDEAYRTDIAGIINNDKFKSKLSISFVDIDVESLQLSNTNANGIFSTNIGINGTWIGQKFALDNAKTTLIPLKKPIDYYIVSCTSINNVLWVYSYIDASFHQIDTTGNEIGTVEYKHSVSKFVADGENIWVYNNGEGFTKINVNGATLNSFKLPNTYFSAMAAHNGSLFCHDSFKRKIYKYNYQGQKTDSIAFPYFNLSDIEYGEGHFYLTEPDLKVVMQTDENFNILKTYPLPENGYSDGNAYFKGSIWYFMNDYSNVTAMSVSLYKIGLQE